MSLVKSQSYSKCLRSYSIIILQCKSNKRTSTIIMQLKKLKKLALFDRVFECFPAFQEYMSKNVISYQYCQCQL